MVNLLISIDKTVITSIGVNIFSSLLVFITGNILLEEKRKKIFNKNFLKNNFNEIHKKEFSEDINYKEYGYPDDGNGIYSNKLNYNDWYDFNKIKRIYDNGIESLNIYLFIHLITSLISSSEGLKISILFLLSRFIYVLYYFFNFSNIIRISGMLINLLCIVWCLVIIWYYLLG